MLFNSNNNNLLPPPPPRFQPPLPPFQSLEPPIFRASPPTFRQFQSTPPLVQNSFNFPTTTTATTTMPFGELTSEKTLEDSNKQDNFQRQIDGVMTEIWCHVETPEKSLKKLQKTLLYSNKPVVYNKTTIDRWTYSSTTLADITDDN